MRTRKLGSGAAGNQAATYALIAAADVGGATHRASSGDSKPRRVASNDDQKRRQKSRVAEREVEGAQVAPQVVLQFNLDSSMSEDQVAHFLELAAKHFFSKN
jgi:hypothetical protein